MIISMKKQYTICVVHQDSRILLGLKKKGFGIGRWNGFGGKVESGENIEEAALRELREEAGLTALDMTKRGVIDFAFENDPKTLEVHIFSATKFQGKPLESDEMSPKWFDIKAIPFEQMWSDDIHWLPMLLSEKLFKGNFLFDRPSDATYSAKIIKMELKEVKEI